MSIILPGLCRFLDKNSKEFWDEGEEVKSLIFGVPDESSMRSLSREKFSGYRGNFSPRRGITQL
jgi:hypothetical protein